LVLYFVASSDSGSMVDDMLSANGLPDPPLPQRFFWAMTEGITATVLLNAGLYTGTPDGGLKALRAISICVGLPYTFLICFMCLALWRAVQYEMKDRAWQGSYFESEIMDIGVTVYEAAEGQDKCFNLKCGKFDASKFFTIVAYCFVPTLAVCRCTDGIASKSNNRIGFGRLAAKGLTVGTTLCFYGYLVLCFLDYCEVSTDALQMGSVKGNSAEKTGTDIYYTSPRYGYFRGWTMDVKDGAKITTNTVVDAQAGEIGVGVGDPMGRNLRIEAIGWFLYLLFATMVALIRNNCRIIYSIPGTLIEDFLASMIAYPTVLYQVKQQVSKDVPDVPDVRKDGGGVPDSI